MRESTFSFWENPDFVQEPDAGYTEELDAFHPPADAFTAETWFFEVMGEEGHLVQLAVGTKDPLLLPGELRPWLRLGVSWPGRPARFAEETFSPAVFDAAQDRCALHLPAGTVEATDQGYRLRVALKEISLDLSLRPTLPPWVPGRGVIGYGDKGLKTLRWCVPLPRAEVEGTLAMGREQTRLRGVGYHDHRASNFSPPELLTGMQWGRVFAGEHTVIFGQIAGVRLYSWKPIRPVLWAKGEEVLASTDKADLVWERSERDFLSRAKYPTRGLLRVQTQPERQVRFDRLVVRLASSLHPAARAAGNNWQPPLGFVLTGEAVVLEAARPAEAVHGRGVFELVSFRRN